MYKKPKLIKLPESNTNGAAICKTQPPQTCARPGMGMCKITYIEE